MQRDALRKVEKQPWFELAFMPKASKLTTDPEHNSWRKEMDEDAVAAVRKVKLPLLFIYGDSDPSIPVGESVQQLRSLINQHHNIQYAVVPNANHEMMYVEHDMMAFDEKTTNEIAPQALNISRSWPHGCVGKTRSDFGIGFCRIQRMADSHRTGVS